MSFAHSLSSRSSSHSAFPDAQPLSDAPACPSVRTLHPSPDEGDFLVRPYARELPTKSSQTLPLELFDNPEFDSTVGPEQLILREDGTRGARARSRYFLQSGEFAWKPCTVLDFDSTDGTFEIQWEGPSQSRKRVKRLNLMFDSEDPARFELRLSVAMAWQRQAQDALRFHRAADAVRLSDAPLHYLDERWELSVQARSGSLADHWPDVVSEVLDEAREEYDAAVRQAVLEHSLEKSTSAAATAGARVTAADPGLRPLRVVAPVPATGCVPLALEPHGVCITSQRGRYPHIELLEREPIENVFDLLDVICLIARPDVVAAKLQFLGILDLRGFHLADVAMAALRRPVSLADFRVSQEAASARASDKVHREWMPQIVNLVEQLLPENADDDDGSDAAGGGSKKSQQQRADAEAKTLSAMALAPHTRREFAILSARRFARLCSLIITETLRTVVHETVQAYADFWKVYRSAEPAVGGADPPSSEPPAAAAAHGIRPPPMFLVTLDIADSCSEMVFNPPLAEIRAGVLQAFESICQTVTGIPELRNSTMGVGPAQTLGTVGLDDPLVQRCYRATEQMLDANFHGPATLVESLAHFSWLAELDEGAFFAKWHEAGGLEDRAAESRRLAEMAADAQNCCADLVEFGFIVVGLSKKSGSFARPSLVGRWADDRPAPAFPSVLRR